MKQLIKKLVRRAGFQLGRYDPRHDVDVRRLRFVADRDIDCVIDIGAHVGSYVRRLRAAGYAGHVVSFEPRESAYSELERAAETDADWSCHHLALGDGNREAELNVSGYETSSSLLEIGDRHVRNLPASARIGTEHVTVRTLDSIDDPFLAQARHPMLKVDVQGGERAVLDGAEATLARAEIVECEISFVELYAGQPLYLEMFGRLDRAGFTPASLEPVVWEESSGRLLQADCIFLRDRR